MTAGDHNTREANPGAGQADPPGRQRHAAPAAAPRPFQNIMNQAQAISQAYIIISGLISLFLSEGNPKPELYNLSEEEALQVADILQELRDHCIEYGDERHSR